MCKFKENNVNDLIGEARRYVNNAQDALLKNHLI